MPFLPLDPFVAGQQEGASLTDASSAAGARGKAVLRDVCGIVLAGTHHWGEGVFERVLRGPLLPVAHAPLINYPLEWLRDAGVASAVVCANSATASLRTVLGDGAAMSLALKYFEDHEPRGPAGCARDASRMSDASVFVVVEGTIVPTLDFDAMLSAHRLSGAAATVVVEFDRRRRGMASGVRRQPAGIYAFERSALAAVSENGYQDIKEGLLGRLNESGAHVAMHEVHGLSAKVLDYSSYAAVSRWLVSRAIERPAFLPHYVRVGEGLHHPTAVVHPSARLIGPILLGAGVRIESDAVVVGPASIGERTVISAQALVTRSFIWDDCHIGDGAMIDSSVLADHCEVPPGERLTSVTQLPDQYVSGDRQTPGSLDAVTVELMPSLDAATTRLRTGFGFGGVKSDEPSRFVAARDQATMQ